MTNQEGVFKWHIACCPCVGPSGCQFSFNPDYGQTIESKFNVTGAGPYGLISNPLYPDYVWVSGDTSFIFKQPIPYNEQNLSCRLFAYLGDTGNSKVKVRFVCDYIDSYNYHYYEIISSGHAVYNWNQDVKLGKRSSGVDTVLEESKPQYRDGYDMCDPIFDVELATFHGSICTGDNAVYGFYMGGLHSPTVLHSGTKVGIIVSDIQDAHIHFSEFVAQDHTEWGNDIAQRDTFSPIECIDCGRCGCSGESPASYRVLIQNLTKAYPTGYDCCTGFNGTYIMEQWGRDYNMGHGTVWDASASEGNVQYCYYHNHIESNPCSIAYESAYIGLWTRVRDEVGYGSISDAYCYLYDCRPNYVTGNFRTLYAQWGKNYTPSTEGGIPCSQFSYEALPFIGSNSLTGYYKYWPCSGDALSCQVTAL